MTLLKLDQVCKNFGGVVTADQVSMEVQPGEIHGLIGPNGAGKTTLLNLISGIYDVNGGNIFLEEKNITTMASHDRAKSGLARTFQSPRFLRRSSIQDNLLLGTDLADQLGYMKSFFGCKGSDFHTQLNRLMKIADFTFDLQDDISTLSYGQQKLLEIVRSLLTHPKLMLIDEPAAGLNSKEIEKAMALIRLAAKERGIGIILIEHSMDMVMNICDNITVLSFGKVIARGVPEEIATNETVITAYLGRDRNA